MGSRLVLGHGGNFTLETGGDKWISVDIGEFVMGRLGLCGEIGI